MVLAVQDVVGLLKKVKSSVRWTGDNHEAASTNAENPISHLRFAELESFCNTRLVLYPPPILHRILPETDIGLGICKVPAARPRILTLVERALGPLADVIPLQYHTSTLLMQRRWTAAEEGGEEFKSFPSMLGCCWILLITEA
jgi:hypothetical protein